MTDVGKFNSQSLGEEIANAVSHGIGTLLAIAATAVLIVRASMYSTAIGIVSACLYGATMIILYCFSTLYHSLTNKKAKKVFQIFDHCSIFLLILGTYIPIALTMLGGAVGWTIFGIITALTVLGIVFNSIDLVRWHKISVVLYILMGWTVVGFAPAVLKVIPKEGLKWLVGGGILYTVGVIFYVMKNKKYMHFIWHLFVLGGTIFHYIFIFLYCYPIK